MIQFYFMLHQAASHPNRLAAELGNCLWDLPKRKLNLLQVSELSARITIYNIE